MRREPTRDPQIFMIDGAYYFRGSVSGKQIERKLIANNLKDAQARKAELIEKYRSFGYASDSTKAIDALNSFGQYLRKECENKALRESTLRGYLQILNSYMKPFWANAMVGDIDQIAFDNYCERYGRRQYRTHVNVLQRFFSWAVRRRLVTSAPQFETPNWTSRKREILTPQEIVAILKNADGDLLLFVACYLLQGMRASEITKLEWARVDFKRRAIILRSEDTKTKMAREVPINQFVLKLLAARDKSGPFVFANKRGVKAKKQYMDGSSFRYAWGALLKRAGVSRHITPHDLRATYEKYAHLDSRFTDTQREKMVGASIDVQKNTYVRQLSADDIRGLENVVDVPNLNKILIKKLGMS